MRAIAKDLVVRECTNGTRMGNLLSFADTAQTLKVSKAQLSKLINGKVPGVPRLKIARLGRRVLVREEALAQWIQEVEHATRIAEEVFRQKEANLDVAVPVARTWFQRTANQRLGSMLRYKSRGSSIDR